MSTQPPTSQHRATTRHMASNAHPRSVPEAGRLFRRVSLAELDAQADASARAELDQLYASMGGWAWTVPDGVYARCPAWWGRRRYLEQVDELLISPAGTAARRRLVSVAAGGCP